MFDILIKFSFLLMILTLNYSCTSFSQKNEVEDKKCETLDKYSNGKIKLEACMISEAVDTIEIKEFYRNGNLKSYYQTVNKERDGFYYEYAENGLIKESKKYLFGKLNHEANYYDTLGRIEFELIYYADTPVYKKEYFYSVNNDFDSTKVDVGLIIDTNTKQGEPFYVNSYSAFGIKHPLPLDTNSNYYIKYALILDNQGIQPLLTDSFVLHSEEFSEIGYLFEDTCSIAFYCQAFKIDKDSTYMIGSSFLKYRVVDSVSYNMNKNEWKQL